MLALLVAAGVASAASDAEALSAWSSSADLFAAVAPFESKPGAWAEYVVRSPRGTARVRFSVLELEAGRVWLEIAAFGDKGLPFAARLLLQRGATRVSDVDRAVVYVLGYAPLDLPVADLRAQLGAFGSAQPPGAVRRVRTARVAVPAGRFEAQELRLDGGAASARIWRASAVPVWGIVRARCAGETMELVAYGHEGARSAIPDHGIGSESTNE